VGGQQGGRGRRRSTGFQRDTGHVEEYAFEHLAEMVEVGDRDAVVPAGRVELGAARGEALAGCPVETQGDLGDATVQVLEDLGVGPGPIRVGLFLADLPGAAGAGAAGEGSLTPQARRVGGDLICGRVQRLRFDPVFEQGHHGDVFVALGRGFAPLLE